MMNTLGSYVAAVHMTRDAAHGKRFSEAEVRLCEALTAHPKLSFRQRVELPHDAGTADFLVEDMVAVTLTQTGSGVVRGDGCASLLLRADGVLSDPEAAVAMIALQVSLLREKRAA